jgi:hypothetical protein
VADPGVARLGVDQGEHGRHPSGHAVEVVDGGDALGQLVVVADGRDQPRLFLVVVGVLVGHQRRVGRHQRHRLVGGEVDEDGQQHVAGRHGGARPGHDGDAQPSRRQPHHVAVGAVGELVLDEPRLAQPRRDAGLGGRRLQPRLDVLVGRAEENVGELYGQVVAQPVGVVGAELEGAGEVGDLVVVVERQSLGELPQPGNVGVGLVEGGHHAVDRLIRDAGRRDHQHRFVLQQLVEQPLPELLVEPRRFVFEVVELAPQRGVAVPLATEIGLEAVQLPLQLVDGGVVEERGSQHEADPQGQQDRGERDDVEAEVDHQPETSERQKARSSSRTGSDSMSATARVKMAAAIIHTKSDVRTECV